MPRFESWKLTRSNSTGTVKDKPAMSLKKGVRASKSKADELPVSGKGIRTRLSTGTIHVSGTQTFKDIKFTDSSSQDGTRTPSQKGQGDSGSSGQKHRLKDVIGAATEGWQGPPPKRRKIGKNDGSGEDNKNDYFCWLCHKDGLMVCCELCPRVYHPRCLGVEDDLPSDWVCPECEKTMTAECIDTQSKAMKMITLDVLCFLLKFTLERMKSCPDSEVFINAVDLSEVPNYTDYVFHPMTLSQIEKNIKKKVYGSTDAFLADAKWILHNSYVFNGIHHKLTSTAKTMLKICKHEVSEIEVCPDCYLSSCKREEHWFCQPCRAPHTLVWAKLKGYPFWPAKVLREEGGQLDVRFFGAHDRSWVSKSQVFLLSEQPPSTMQKRSSGMDMAMEEVKIHVEKIRSKFGSFEYDRHRTPYDNGHVYSPLRIKVKKRLKNPKKKYLVQKSSASTTEAKPAEKVSVLSKTASALKSKYNSIITTRRVSGTKVKTVPAGVFKVSHKDSEDTEPNPFNSPDEQDLSVPKPRLPDKEVIRKLEEKIVQINEEIEAVSSGNVSDKMEDDAKRSSDASKPEPQRSDVVMLNQGLARNCETKTNSDRSKDNNNSINMLGKVVKDADSMDVTVKVVKDRVLDTPDTGSSCSTPSKSEYMSNLKKTISSCIEQLGITEDKLEESAVCSSQSEEDSDDDLDENEGQEVSANDTSLETKEKPSADSGDSVEKHSKYVSSSNSESSQQTSTLCKQTAKLSDSLKQTSDKEEDKSRSSSSSSCSDSEKQTEKSESSTSRLDDTDASRILKKHKGRKSAEDVSSNSAYEAKAVLEVGEKDSEIGETISERNLKRQISSEDVKKKYSEDDDQKRIGREHSREKSVEKDSKDATGCSVQEMRQNFKHVIEEASSKAITKTQVTESCEVHREKVTPHTKYNVMKLNSDFEPTLVMEIDSGEESDSRLVIDFEGDYKTPKGSGSRADILSIRSIADNMVIKTSDTVVMPIVTQTVSASDVIRCYPKTTSLYVPSETAGKMSVLSTVLQSVSKSADNTSPSASAPKPASSEGIPSSVIDTYTNKLVTSLKGPLEEFVGDIWHHAQSEVKGQASSAELSELRYIHSQEIMELKHNFKLTVAEMKAAWEAEKNKLFRELKRIFDQEKEACVAAAKKKQWCANCSKEAIYYCCWNTSYCDYACQQAHWPEHLPSCMQASQESEKTSKSDASPAKTPTTSVESSTLVKTTTPHSQSSWAEKEEAIQAQKAFNLTPPSNVPTLQNSSQSEPWRTVPRQQQMATNIQFLSQPGFQVLPPQVSQPLRLQSQVVTGQTGIPSIVPHGQVIANANAMMYPMMPQPMNPARSVMPRASVFLAQNGGGQPPAGRGHNIVGHNVIPNQMQFQLRPSF